MKKKILVLLMTLCIYFSLGVNLVNFYNSYKVNGFVLGLINGIFKFDKIVSSILVIGIYYFLYKYKKKSNWMINILSGIFAFFMIAGCSYMHYGNFMLLFSGSEVLLLGTIISWIGYLFLFQFILCYVFEFFDKFKLKDSKNKFIKVFIEHPFIISLVIILICWLPYIIINFPIILEYDGMYQISLWYGDTPMNIHHPLIHTLFIKGCLMVGELFKSYTVGLFTYSLVQILVLSMTFAYLIKYFIKDLKLSNIWGIIFLLVYALVPCFPFYAMTSEKDVLYCAFFIMYLVTLHKFYRKEKEGYKLKDYLLLFLWMILVVLFRNNGIYIIVLSFPFFIIVLKKYWKGLVSILLVAILLYEGYMKVLLPVFDIEKGSIREMFSVPMQQTARYYIYYSGELSHDEYDKINNVLKLDGIEDRYNPELSDPVKETFKYEPTSEDLKDYFSVWFKELVRHPDVYIDATVNNVYGYFYPLKESWTNYIEYDNDNKDLSGIEYKHATSYEVRDKVHFFAEYFKNIPVLGLIYSIGFNTWIVFILVGYSIYKKKYKLLVLYLPILLTILMCIVSPVNTCFRYALPYIFSMPLLISLVFDKKI